MSKAMLNSEYGLYEHNGHAFASSLDVAIEFEKEHRRVLQDIREMECSDDFRLHHFVQSSYLNEQNKKQPRTLMTKDGFTLLVMGYTGKKAMEFKELYIKRFNEMESFIRILHSLKLEHPAFTDAIHRSHAEPKHYHYSNEADMINRIVLGVSAKQYREARGLDESAGSIRPYLSGDEIQMIDNLQRIDIGLMVAGLTFEARKIALLNYIGQTRMH